MFPAASVRGCRPAATHWTSHTPRNFMFPVGNAAVWVPVNVNPRTPSLASVTSTANSATAVVSAC
jgi:hypothetical protein